MTLRGLIQPRVQQGWKTTRFLTNAWSLIQQQNKLESEMVCMEDKAL